MVLFMVNPVAFELHLVIPEINGQAGAVSGNRGRRDLKTFRWEGNVHRLVDLGQVDRGFLVEHILAVGVAGLQDESVLDEVLPVHSQAEDGQQAAPAVVDQVFQGEVNQCAHDRLVLVTGRTVRPSIHLLKDVLTGEPNYI